MNTSLHRKKRQLALDERLGKELAKLRKDEDLRQVDIAEAMDVKRPLISKIEHGQRSLAAFEVVDYARALHMQPSTLQDMIARISIEYDAEAERLRAEAEASNEDVSTLQEH